MPLVVGLGNPGKEYALTRHNVGWRVVEILARRWKAGRAKRLPGSRWWAAEVGGKPVHLMQPMTYMNVSGEALDEWRAKHRFALEDLLVVADDVYLPFGTLRLRPRGSSGGHRGLESIEAALGGREYARLRIGVGAPEPSGAAGDAGVGARLREHVLEEFEERQEAAVAEVLRRAADAVECWVREGTTVAMNRFNRSTLEEESKP